MNDILIMLVVVVVLYVFWKIMNKEPILPWKEKDETAAVLKKKKKKRKRHQVEIEEEPQLFKDLFPEVKDIENHMIRFKDNSFTVIAEVDPVNYFLKSQDEQEAIDITVESWTATLNYPVGFYFQNRFIDVSEPIEMMSKAMQDSEDLNEAALSFGQSMIQDIINWQKETPRYETRRYLIFTHKIKTSELTADNAEELEQKVIDKAFAELMRRLNAAKNQLRKADIIVSLLPTEGIYELLYHTFNRRKALKHRFKDLVDQEKNAMYATADQSDERIELVKEALEVYEKEQEQKEREIA